VSWLTAVPGGAQVGGDPDIAAIVGRLSGGTVLTVSLGRTFPDGDRCWVEVFGTIGYERIPFMWGAPGEDVFHAALVAQAEASAAAVHGGEVAGASTTDAVAAITAAELARHDGRARAAA
jgi:hypothetical protein